MKNIYVLLFAAFISLPALAQTEEVYDMDYVSFGTKTYENEEFQVVKLKRKNMRVRAKYFAAEIEGKSVADRYAEWSKNKNIVCYSSGAYMNDLNASNAGLVGLTIDYGKVVNEHLKTGELDALVVVYPNGEVDVTNLKEGTIKLVGSGTEVSFDLKSSMQVEKFIDWAKSESLTVFQTHLLAFNNELKIGGNSSSTKRERRLLVVSEDRKGNKVHYIIHKEEYASLLDATSAVLNYLKGKGYSVESIINLDTGAQDVFRFYNYDGTISDKLAGKMELNGARNLVVYYYQ